MRPGEIKALRERLSMTQEQFAEALGLNPGTLRNWEQGIRSPAGPALALLAILDLEPEAALRALKRARRRR
jgi:putative transcriptional regulator